MKLFLTATLPVYPQHAGQDGIYPELCSAIERSHQVPWPLAPYLSKGQKNRDALEPGSLAKLNRMGPEASVGVSVMSPPFPDFPGWVTTIAYKEVTGRERGGLTPSQHLLTMVANKTATWGPTTLKADAHT